MSKKSATIMCCIEPALKRQAEDILHQLGIPISVVITCLYKQILLQ